MPQQFDGPLDSIWKALAEARAAKIALLEKRLAQRQEAQLPCWPSERSITVILTVHGDKRLGMAKEAYASILAAGFHEGQIRICLLRSPRSGHSRALEAFRHCAPIDQLDSADKNAAWMCSCDRADSSHVIILNDDDLMKPGLADKLKERDDWEAACWDSESVSNYDGCASYFRCREGVYHGALASDLASRLCLTIPASQGCFPRNHAISCFEEFAQSHSDLRSHEEIQVGNELMLWLRMERISKLWVVRSIHSQCRYEEDSATLSHGSAIAKLCTELRRRLGSSEKKIVPICHLWGEGIHPEFMDNLHLHKPRTPVRFISSRAIKGVDSIRIPDYATGCMEDPENRCGSANCAFVEASKIAAEEGAHALFYIETDCRFSGEGWDEALRQEFFGAGPDVACVGSPVVCGALSAGHKRSLHMWDYASRYTKDTGLFMAFEGFPDDRNFALYPNGALAFYTTELLEDSYLLKSRSLGVERYAKSTEIYDLHIGRMIGGNGHEFAARKVGWLRSSYSGCFDHHYTLQERLQMLAGGDRVAVHQVKL